MRPDSALSAAMFTLPSAASEPETTLSLVNALRAPFHAQMA